MAQIEFKGYQLMVGGSFQGGTGCGDRVLASPVVCGGCKPGTFVSSEVPREILVEYLSYHYVPLLCRETGIGEYYPPVLFLNRVEKSALNDYAPDRLKTHDLILSGDCGIVIQCPAVANYAHGNVAYDGALLPYIWIPKMFEKSMMQGPLYTEDNQYTEVSKGCMFAMPGASDRKKNLKQKLTKAGYL